MFLDISLGYVDECCLGYTFAHPEQNAYKLAADGVVIYFKNWKTLLKDAAKTTGVVILSFVAVTLVAFVLFGGLFRLFGWSGFMAFIISLLFAYTVKYAFYRQLDTGKNDEQLYAGSSDHPDHLRPLRQVVQPVKKFKRTVQQRHKRTATGLCGTSIRLW